LRVPGPHLVTTVAAVVADALAAGAADRVFAFPGGGSNLDVIAALGDRDVEVVLCRSEGGAAFAAATYADLTGRPAAVLVGLGPGVANAVDGVAHAFLDQSALVVISDRFTDPELDTSGHQVLDHRALLAPVTKGQTTLSADGAVAALVQALELAATPPRGPVHLELPRDVAGEEAAVPPGPGLPAAGRLPDAGVPVEGAAALAAARRPVLLVGDEAASVPQADLVALAVRLGSPVLSSYKGKGVFPEDHELWCGIVTNAAVEASLLEEADVVLAVGLDPVELLPRAFEADARVLALREHRERAPGYRPVWTALGPLPGLVARLMRLVPSSASEWTREEVAGRRSGLLDRLRVGPADGLGAIEAIEAVCAVAPPETTVTVDAGAHMFAATWFWRSRSPRRFLISNGLATMGYAVPAAVGAALARPQEPVVAFTGDGGFLLHGVELETAVRLGVAPVVVVLNDASLSLIRIKQEDRGFERSAVDFSRLRLDLFARSLGAEAARVDDGAGLARAVAAGFERSLPTVVEAVLSGGEYGALQRAIRGDVAAGRSG
jgi:acetolactate synthase I/II/III large subunit